LDSQAMIEQANGDVSPSDLTQRLARGDQISQQELVELLCCEQVKRWRAGERIPAEAYLKLHPSLAGDGEAAFELVYGEYLIRELMGEPPKLNEFLWRFPRFAERLRRQLSLHQALSDDETIVEDVSPHPLPAGDDAPAPTPQLPGYLVMEEVGRGGMSVVFRARQVHLNRLVALKVIRAKIYADATIAARFRDEAEAAARFQHPNIIQVYEVGEHDGQGFIALEYAAGGTLEEKLAGTPQPPRDAAQAIECLARALHYAHQRGIVHRDLKPANVVLTEDGVPKVTDFGLAKLLEREAGLTQTGDIMGTPSYMAPEQAQGTPSDVTPATDIYALGAILYEMLTGRPPFKAATPLSTLSQVAGQEPLAPGKLQRHTPRELETICLKCLEKEPKKRYATALDLADDLRRLLENRPIRARRISPLEWTWRWCRREPAKAGLIVALMCAFVAGAVGVATQWLRADEKARAEALARGRAEVERGRALDNVYFSRIAQARLEWRLNNVFGSNQLLDHCDPSRRGWEWHYLRNLRRSELLGLEFPELNYIVSAVFSPDGKRFAFAGFNPYDSGHEHRASSIEIWDTTTLQRLHALNGPARTMRLSYRPDGKELAASGTQETQIRDTTTGQLIRTWSPGGSVVYSSDARLLVSGNETHAIFWEVASGKEVRRFPKNSGRVTLSPDGQVLAVSGADTVDLHEVSSGRKIRALAQDANEKADRIERIFGGEGPDLAFSPDGRRLVVAARTPRIWDVTTGQLLHQLGGHAGTVPGVAFSPDGRQVATAGSDSTIRVWDANTGAERALLRGHASWAGCVAFQPEGRSLLTGGRHIGQVRLWDLTRPQEYLSLPRASAPAMTFNSGGRNLKLVTAAGRLQIREIESGTTRVGACVDMTQSWLTPAVTAEFSGDGQRLATVSNDRLLVKLWDGNSGTEMTTLSGLAAPATYLAVSRNGGRVAAAGLFARNKFRSREVKVWDSASGSVLASFTPSRAPISFTHGRVALSADGERVAYDDYDLTPTEAPESMAALQQARLKICDVNIGRVILSLSMGVSIVYSVAFSADGALIAAGNQDGDLFVWDARSGEVLVSEKQPAFYFRLAFSPDGRRLAGVDREKVQMWNARDGQEILLLRGAQPRAIDGGFNPSLAWSPDGQQLAALNWNGSVSVWNASELPNASNERFNDAQSRAFAWHLAQAEAAAAEKDMPAVLMHLAELQTKEPPDGTTRVRRGRLYMLLGQWDKADADYAHWFQSGEPNDDEGWLSYARVLIARGDREGYRRLCDRVLEALQKPFNQESAWIAAHAVGLAAGSRQTAARIVSLAEARISAQRRHPHYDFALGLAHFRATEWEQARLKLRTFTEGDSINAWRAWPVLAMIEYRTGHVDESRRDLAKALQWLDQHNPTAKRESGGSIVAPDWLDFESHCREAAAMLGQAK
jgi:WD40 repeat protein/Flp pilus assembly protein TadD/tRNA A-37 threonylcarbamoyl transferase component Bud32